MARETGATPDQAVLARQPGGSLPVVTAPRAAILPLAGASSVARPAENLAAVDQELTPEQRGRPDGAHRAGVPVRNAPLRTGISPCWSPA
ncbi:hypothetical protein [Streptomyces sp. NPDC001270]|uniref:hypothetical protein n=1 Tax=Streptomyces sp. NPDC001270 TaxID=3364554 RepID=UPI0036741FB9